MTDKAPDRRHKTRRSLLVLTGLVLGAIILAIYVSSKRPGAFMSEEWRYRHFVSLDDKIRRLNESPWNMEDGPRLSYPGGCGVVPYSREIVMIQQFEPLLLAVQDNETGEVRTMQKIDGRTFQFTSKDYPIEITLFVTDILPGDSCRFAISARKASGGN